MTDGKYASAKDNPAFPWMNVWQGPQFWSAFGNCARASEPVARGAACTQLEMTSLVGNRLRAWTQIPETLSRCRTPMDLFQAQVAFWQEAGRNYTEATQHVVSAWRGMMPAFNDPVGDRVEPRDYITFPEPKVDAAPDERRRPGESRRAA